MESTIWKVEGPGAVAFWAYSEDATKGPEAF